MSPTRLQRVAAATPTHPQQQVQQPSRSVGHAATGQQPGSRKRAAASFVAAPGVAAAEPSSAAGLSGPKQQLLLTHCIAHSYLCPEYGVTLRIGQLVAVLEARLTQEQQHGMDTQYALVQLEDVTVGMDGRIWVPLDCLKTYGGAWQAPSKPRLPAAPVPLVASQLREVCAMSTCWQSCMHAGCIALPCALGCMPRL